MLRKTSKAIPEGNGPPPQDAYKMITWEELRLSESMSKSFGEFKEDLRSIDQRLASLEWIARQPRLAMEADVPADKKTRELTEGATTAVQAKHGDSCSANRVDPDPKRSTSFGDDLTEPSALPCSRDDALVGNGAVVPKSCLSPLEVCTPTAAGGLFPTGTTSTATRTTFDQSHLWFCPTEDANSENISIQYASYYSSFSSLLPHPGEGLYEQNRGKLWYSIQVILQVISAPVRALLYGGVFNRALDEAASFFGG